VNQKSCGYASKTNTSLIPAIDFDIRSVQDVFAKDDGVRTGPACRNVSGGSLVLRRNERLTQEHHISCVHASSEELRSLVDEFQVVLLTAILWNRGAELQVDSHACSSDDTTRNPKEEGQSNTSRKLQDTAGSSKDTRSNHAVKHKERSRNDTDLALVRGSSGMFAINYEYMD
jgi:hypothetical protein